MEFHIANTPDIRQIFYRQFDNLDTPSTMTSDDWSNAGTKVVSDEQMHLNTAIRNSMKDQFEKTAFTPDGSQHISELRAQRALFHSQDKEKVLERKRSSVDLSVDSPIVKKASNRISNNGLDPAYFALTQQEISSPYATPPSLVNTASHANNSSSKKFKKWEQSIRLETMRRMRSNDNSIASDAKKLYRLFSRKDPKEEYTDMMTIAKDADDLGMTVDDTVDMMLAMFHP